MLCTVSLSSPSVPTRERPGHGFLDAQKQALEMIVNGEPLADVLTHLTQVVEQESGNAVVASILLLDEENRLRSGAAPSLPGEYSTALDGLKVDPLLGTCSAAAATGRVVITQDFDTDPAWAPLKHLPLALGLVAAWSQPIVNHAGRVLGTFGTYFRERRGPTAAERQVVEILSHTAALAIERARAEERRRADERAKDEFIATLSHELRNPLAPLRTALELLRMSASDADAVLRLHARMSRQVEQLVRLVDDLLEVSRMTRGDVRLQLQPVDVNTVVQSALETCAPVVASAGVEVSAAAAEGPVFVTGDALRLGQIVSNLLNNAAKYTKPGGRVAIQVRRRQADVEVAVRDTGIGIEHDDLERIFEAFVRVPHEGAEFQWGLGLGLALSRRFAEMHGGTLEAASAGRNQGSEFTLRLPARPA